MLPRNPIKFSNTRSLAFEQNLQAIVVDRRNPNVIVTSCDCIIKRGESLVGGDEEEVENLGIIYLTNPNSIAILSIEDKSNERKTDINRTLKTLR